MGKKNPINQPRRVPCQKKNTYIFESRPQVRTILLSDSLQGYASRKLKGRRSLPLAFPYVQYVVVQRSANTASLYVSFSNKPVKNGNSRVYFPALSNVYADVHVCTAEATSHVLEKSLDEQSMLKAIGLFWQSRFEFGVGLGWIGEAIVSYSLGTLNKWYNLSAKEDALQRIVQVDWPMSFNLSDLGRVKKKFYKWEGKKKPEGKANADQILQKLTREKILLDNR